MFAWFTNLFRRKPVPTYLLDTQFICWVCQKPRDHSTGISLTDPQSLHGRVSQVCSRCWNEISPANRVIIMRFSRPADLGGMGWVEAAQSIIARQREASRIDRLEEEDIRHGEEWKRGADDDLTTEERIRRDDRRYGEPFDPYTIHGPDLEALKEEQLRKDRERKKRPPKKAPPPSQEKKPTNMEELLDDDSDHSQQGT